MSAADIRLFATDLDGTLLGNPESTWRFAQAWAELPAGTRPLLVYNTGRTVADTLGLVGARGLPDPDYIIGSIGTELHDSLYHQADEFRSQFDAGWNAARVDQIVGAIPGIRRQPGEFLHHYKSSWYWQEARSDEVDQLRRQLTAAGIDALVIYSCRYFLDVVPAYAGKGKALAWLCRRLGIPLKRVLVAGDTGNDSEMFQLAGINGIVVQNATPELHAAVLRRHVVVTNDAMADGVIEGLRHFGVLPAPIRPPAVARVTAPGTPNCGMRIADCGT